MIIQLALQLRPITAIFLWPYSRAPSRRYSFGLTAAPHHGDIPSALQPRPITAIFLRPYSRALHPIIPCCVLAHSPPQTCVLASPFAVNGCAYQLIAISIGLNATGSLPFIWLNAMGSLPFQLASMPQVPCLSFGLMPRVHCHFNWLQCHGFIATFIWLNATG